MIKITLETTLNEVDSEDSGQAMIAHVEDPKADDEFFVRLHSWSEERKHILMRSLIGKKVRVTVETIDED